MDELMRRGIKLRRVGAEYVGPCPKCGGTDRFSVNPNKAVWNCRGCSTGGDVIDLVHHLDGGTFDMNVTTLAGPNNVTTFVQKANGKANGKHASAEPVVTEHPYCDENGEIQFVVVRIEQDGKKTISQKRPDPNNPKHWISNTQGCRVIPYKLPELIEAIANDRLIVIGEGENKVDLLASWNIAATCNCGGAGKWKAEHAAFLEGADVVILPDNDSVGFEHAASVARSLVGVAKRIRRVVLPDLPPKGDIVDWADAGGTREKLDELIAQASDWIPGTTDATPAEQPETQLEVFDASDDVDLPPPRGWLLDNQFCRGFLSSLVAPGAVGKTALRLAQLLSLATERSLTGQHVFVRCRVLLLSFEDGRDELRRRVAAACIHHNINRGDLKGWLYYATPKGIKLAELTNGGGARQRGKLEQELRDQIVKIKPDIVCLDPFVKTHSLEENDNSAMDFVCDLMAALADEFNIAVDAPHHARKGLTTPGDADTGRGGSSIRDAGRLVYTLTPMSEAEADQFNIEAGDRRSFIRLDSAKVNIVRTARSATWFKLVSVNIGNGTEQYPSGDEVQTVEPWAPPDTWAVSSVTLNAVLTDIDAGLPNGQRYSNAPAAGQTRQVWRVIQKHIPDHSEAQCREIISAWLRNDILYPESYDDPVQRKPLQGLRLDPAKRPS
jgi:hypothetical protein